MFTQNNFFIRRYLFNFIKENQVYLHGKIMDFWCGESPYKHLLGYTEYIGIDIGESWHDNKNNKNIIFYDGKCLPYPSSYFDSFICTEVFEHVFDLKNALKEINRVIYIWGRGIITVPFCIEEHEKPYDFARYTSFGIRAVLEDCGFEIQIHKKTGSYWEVVLQAVRNYIGLIFSSRNTVLNFLLKVIFVLPFHIIFLLLFFLVPRVNQDMYFNNVMVVKKIRDIL